MNIIYLLTKHYFIINLGFALAPQIFTQVRKKSHLSASNASAKGIFSKTTSVSAMKNYFLNSRVKEIPVNALKIIKKVQIMNVLNV